MKLKMFAVALLAVVSISFGGNMITNSAKSDESVQICKGYVKDGGCRGYDAPPLLVE